MNARADFDAFAGLLRDVEADFRYAARQHASDEASTDSLMFTAATRLASRWSTASLDDPKRHLLEGLEHHSNTLWRDEETPAYSPRGIAQLIESAWLTGRQMRRRKRRRAGVFALVAVVIASMYLWSINVSSLDAENGDAYGSAVDSPSAVTVLDSHTVALPAPDVIARTPFLQSMFPSDLDVVASQAPPLEGSGLDSLAAVFHADSYWPVMVAPNGLARSVNLSEVAAAPDQVRLWPRSISNDRERFAVGVNSTIIIVDRTGDIEAVPPPSDSGPLLDVAWPPSSEAVQATFEAGTWLLAPHSDPVPLDWFGQATTFHYDTGQPIEFTSAPASEVAIRTWEGDEVPSPTAAEASPPISTWSGPPVADTGRYVRGCESTPEANVAGAPMPWCVAVLSQQPQLEWFLLAADRYTGVTVLGARDGEVFLAVRSASEMADQRILLWRLSDHRLLHLTTVTNDANVALGTW